MFIKLTMMIMLVLGWGASIYAQEGAVNLSDARDQVREEQRREGEIQMMRLELEKLKIELETRQTKASIGNIGGVSSSMDRTMPVDIDVESIVLMPSEARAVIRIDGERRSIKENDTAGIYLIKKINREDVILIDNKGVELTLSVKQ